MWSDITWSIGANIDIGDTTDVNYINYLEQMLIWDNGTEVNYIIKLEQILTWGDILLMSILQRYINLIPYYLLL